MIRDAAYRHAKRKAHALALEAIDEICEELLKEGGLPALLKGVAQLLHGDVIPASVVLHLKRQVAEIRKAAGRRASRTSCRMRPDAAHQSRSPWMPARSTIGSSLSWLPTVTSRGYGTFIPLASCR